MADPLVWRNVQPVVQESLKHLLSVTSHQQTHIATALTELAQRAAEIETLRVSLQNMEGEMDALWERVTAPAPPPVAPPSVPIVQQISCNCEGTLNDVQRRLQRIERDLLARLDETAARYEDADTNRTLLGQHLAALTQRLQSMEAQWSSIQVQGSARRSMSASSPSRRRRDDGDDDGLDFGAAAVGPTVTFASRAGSQQQQSTMPQELHDVNFRRVHATGKLTHDSSVLWTSQAPSSQSAVVTSSTGENTSRGRRRTAGRAAFRVRQGALLTVQTSCWVAAAAKVPSPKALRLAICVNGAAAHVSSQRCAVQTTVVNGSDVTAPGQPAGTCYLGHAAPFCEFAEDPAREAQHGVFTTCGRCGGCMAMKPGEENLPTYLVTLNAECRVYVPKGFTLSVKVLGDGARHVKLLGGSLQIASVA